MKAELRRALERVEALRTRLLEKPVEREGPTTRLGRRRELVFREVDEMEGMVDADLKLAMTRRLQRTPEGAPPPPSGSGAHEQARAATTPSTLGPRPYPGQRRSTAVIAVALEWNLHHLLGAELPVGPRLNLPRK